MVGSAAWASLALLSAAPQAATLPPASAIASACTALKGQEIAGACGRGDASLVETGRSPDCIGARHRADVIAVAMDPLGASTDATGVMCACPETRGEPGHEIRRRVRS